MDKIATNEDFLCEVVETASISRLSSSNNYHYLELEGYAELRCQKALQDLREKLRLEARTARFGYVWALPLYVFDFDRVPLLKRPKLASLKSLAIKGFISEVYELGFSCFIDLVGLSPLEMRDDSWSELPAEFHIQHSIAEMDRSYFKQLDVPIPNNYQSPMMDWGLYVLMPGRELPQNFLLRRLLGR